jgi:pyridoxal phosphate enzyme (YggS family)
MSSIISPANLLVKSNLMCYNVPLFANNVTRPPFTTVLDNNNSGSRSERSGHRASQDDDGVECEAIADRIRRVTDEISRTVERIGRREGCVSLMAVTKRQPAAAIAAAVDAGLTMIGENYVAEAAAKRAQIVAPAQWHLIGHLQTNKARAAFDAFDVVQSVDSDRIAAALSAAADAKGVRLPILIQIRLGEEPTKSGLPPLEGLELAGRMSQYAALDLRGLMGVAPLGEHARPYYRELRRTFELLPTDNRQVLSMGMSSDYRIAIEEGSTLVRVGTAIFGARQ